MFQLICRVLNSISKITVHVFFPLKSDHNITSFNKICLELTAVESHQAPRIGQAFAKCDGSPQTKHLLSDIGSPVADTNVVAIWPRPQPRPRPVFRLGLRLDAAVPELLIFDRGTLFPPLPLSTLSSHLQKDALFPFMLTRDKYKQYQSFKLEPKKLRGQKWKNTRAYKKLSPQKMEPN